MSVGFSNIQNNYSSWLIFFGHHYRHRKRNTAWPCLHVESKIVNKLERDNRTITTSDGEV
jgi:hypothetical protein